MPRATVAATALVLCLALPAPVAAAVRGWAWPVRGAVLRSFFYDAAAPFRGGRRRGVDLAAPRGATVRAACAGRVVTARPGWVVTLRCGPWRVTHLPLAALAVHVGDRVRAGHPLGTLGTRSGRAGLHLGVRRAGDPFGYVDPLAFLPPDRSPRPGPLPPPAGRRPQPHAAPPVIARRLRPAPPQPAPPAGRVRVPVPGGVAPWPAWVGLALALSGALGGGVRWRARARRARAPARTGERVA